MHYIKKQKIEQGGFIVLFLKLMIITNKSRNDQSVMI